jgi:hypothetical protein
LKRLGEVLAMEASGREPEWAESLADALGRVEAAFRQHRSGAKAPGGMLGEVDQTRPTLVRQAEGVRSGHNDLLRLVVDLRQEVRRATKASARGPDLAAKPDQEPLANVAALRDQAKQLYSRIRQNMETEANLLRESINTDIGVGD